MLSVGPEPPSTGAASCGTLPGMPDPVRLPCPCCGRATLAERGGYEICPVCFWEDDGQDSKDADVRRAGPNHVSLTEGRRNYLTIGAAEAKDLPYVRPPAADEPQGRVFVVVGDRVQEARSI